MKNLKYILVAGLCASSIFSFVFTSCKDDDKGQPQEQDGNLQGVTVNGTLNNHTYVDLGLPSGLKWATYNVGATKPTETGDYFAWGETKPKDKYSWDNYAWGSTKMTKYTYADNSAPEDDGSVAVAAEDDAAVANWGGTWRMPTKDEQAELLEGCDWKWTTNFNGSNLNGQLGTSKTNGNTIFLPATGGFYEEMDAYGEMGYYWSSTVKRELTPSPYTVVSILAYCIEEGADNEIKTEYNPNIHHYANERCIGMCVRAVAP